MTADGGRARGARAGHAGLAELAGRIEGLLADPAHQGHPLREALADLWGYTNGQLARIERITHISDAYQAMAKEHEVSMGERFERQMRRLGKVARISDRYQEMMRELNTTLRDVSYRDPLTGLYNRRLVTERMREDAGRAVAAGRSYAIALIDIDHFKEVNDCYGHDLGDRVLVEFARVLTECVRDGELCARWGGEEFLLVLPGAAPGPARGVALRVQEKLRRQPLMAGSQPLWLTISVGIAQVRVGEHFSVALDRADQALYRAKQLGRDRICDEDEIFAA